MGKSLVSKLLREFVRASGGDPVRVARHAPVAGCIAVEPGAIAWVASPGDSVLKLTTQAATEPTKLRDRGIFSGVAAADGRVFIVEAIGAGGVLHQVSGGTTTRLVAFEGAPRAVMADATHVYIVTPTRILRTTHTKAALETIAEGTGFSHGELEGEFLYVMYDGGGSHVVARVSKNGGALAPIVQNVRDAPIAIDGEDVFFFSESKPDLVMVRPGAGEPRILSEDEAFSSPTAIAVDDASVFVATSARETGAIVRIARPR